MDPASVFELALNGLSTKDLDNPDVYEDENNDLGKDLRHDNKDDTDIGGDILMSALVSAGIGPTTLAESDSRNSVSNIKILSPSSGQMLKVLPNSQNNRIRFIKPNESQPNIIRKRLINGQEVHHMPNKILRPLMPNGGLRQMMRPPSFSAALQRWRNGETNFQHRPNFLRPTFLNRPLVKPFMMKPNDEDEEDDLAQAETYAEYIPQKLKIGQPHPDAVVESSSLSSVTSPDIRYQLNLGEEIVNSGCISSTQLEAVVYALQRHECILPNGQRAGFLVGDGAGVGKGRTIAAIIYENYLLKKKKAIWLSVSNDLKVDAERDLRDVGLKKMKVHSLNKFKYARISGKTNGKVKKGIIFCTYSSLIGESQGGAKAKYKTRLKQLVHWCGKDFDGLIVFDECHRAKNLTPSGSQKPTKTGLRVLELQNKLPNARIIYASATGATEPRNMGYMIRLGLWGQGTPFKTFNDFISTLERRGVGAMELVAMDMKLRGMYLARQLSFKGVEFQIVDVPIQEVEINNISFVEIYNQSADLWVYTYKMFFEAASMSQAPERFRKTMWGQFWSAHQRFFKYLCIAAKIDACVTITRAAIEDNKCVVIGIQTTGESKTLELVDEIGNELGDFVSTAKGVYQSLVEKYFPTKLNIENFASRSEKTASAGDKNNTNTLNRAGKAVSGGNGSGLGLKDILGEKMLAKLVAGGSISGNGNTSSHSDSDDKDDSDVDSDDDEDDDEQEGKNNDVSSAESLDAKKTGSTTDSDYLDSDLECTNQSKTAINKKKKKKVKKKDSTNSQNRRKQSHTEKQVENSDDDAEVDPDAMFDKFMAKHADWNKNSFSKNFLWSDESTRELSDKYLSNPPSTQLNQQQLQQQPRVDVQRQLNEMFNLLLKFIDKLGPKLPPASLDELIDKFGGPSQVAEMTGRKGRVVMDENGKIAYESRRESDVNLEVLNLTEKQRFMDGEKLVAIISEAASSGISLQADRRALNQRRRVHITLELPWSADRAIQQFGRTHRSNQVSAPQYIFLISDLAGEQRFASTVARRLESLGALTHGDRRATDTRDLSRFNIDTKLGRDALEIVMRSCIHGDQALVDPPDDYFNSLNNVKTLSKEEKQSKFFSDVTSALQGVGLLTDKGRDRDINQMTKFLNRILGMRVNVQNALFRYFSDTLEELVRKAKREKRLDLGIMDLGITGQNLELEWTRSFDTRFLSDSTQIHLHKVNTQRGMSWSEAMEIYTQHDGCFDGFYLPKLPASNVNQPKIQIPLLAIYVKTRSGSSLTNEKSKQNKDGRYYKIFRPHTGLQSKTIEIDKLNEKFYRVKEPSEVSRDWKTIFAETGTKCIHMVQHNHCPRFINFQNGLSPVPCDTGLRTRSYYVLSGSVLNVWGHIEHLLQVHGSGPKCMQIVRLKPLDRKRIVGSLIPPEKVDEVLQLLQRLQENKMVYDPNSGLPFYSDAKPVNLTNPMMRTPKPSLVGLDRKSSNLMAHLKPLDYSIPSSRISHSPYNQTPNSLLTKRQNYLPDGGSIADEVAASSAFNLSTRNNLSPIVRNNRYTSGGSSIASTPSLGTTSNQSSIPSPQPSNVVPSSKFTNFKITWTDG